MKGTTRARGPLGRYGYTLAAVSLLLSGLLARQPATALAATYSVSTFDISTRDTAELRPRISGRTVVWQDYRNNPGAAIDENANADIYFKNLDTDSGSTRANEDHNTAKRPAISGDIIVWTAQSSTHGLDILGYNIAKKDHFDVETGNGDQDFPAVSDNIVVWQDFRNGKNWVIRGYDIAKDHHFDIATGSSNHTQPAIDGNLVAWTDDRDGPGKTDIFGYDLSTNTEFRVTDSHDAHDPAVAGSYIVYVGSDNSGIYVYNRADGSTRQISSTTSHTRATPRISGTIVVWEDERAGTGKQDIWGYDLSTNTEFPVVTGGDDQYAPDVSSTSSGTTIVWTDESNHQDVIGGNLTISGVTPPPATRTPPVAQPAPHDARYFFESGFRIDDDRIWKYFNERGGVRNFGYPISRTFPFLGFTTQFFQRQLVQIGPDGNPRLMNLLDPGLMPVDHINGSTFPSYDPNVVSGAPAVGSPGYDTAVIAFVQAHAPQTVNGKPTNFWSTFNNSVTCQDAFPNQPCQQNLLPGLNLEIWGIPTSNPQADPNNPNFIYLRFQRGIMHYDATCNCTQGILLASYLRDVIIGQNLPPDLDAEMKNSPYYKQYNNNLDRGLNRPQDLPGTDLTNAFERQ